VDWRLRKNARWDRESDWLREPRPAAKSYSLGVETGGGGRMT